MPQKYSLTYLFIYSTRYEIQDTFSLFQVPTHQPKDLSATCLHLCLLLEEGNGCCQRPYPREARPQLRRTLQNHVMAKEMHLPPRDTRRTKVAPSMERQAPTKVLPVEMIAWRATFLIFQFTLVNFFSTILFEHLCFFSPKGRSFLQRTIFLRINDLP